MPDVQEVFRLATREVGPEPGFVDRQLGRQRRRTRNRRNGAIALASALTFVAAAVVMRPWTVGSREPIPAPASTPTSTEPAPGRVFGPNGGDVKLTREVRLVEFRSPAYPYSIGYPEMWFVRESSRQLTDLGLPLEWSPGTDFFSGADPDASFVSYPGLTVGAQPVDHRTTLRAWTRDVEIFVDVCGPPATKEAVSVDGEDAILAFFPGCNYPGKFQYWTTIVHHGMGYHIIWTGYTGDEARDRAVLERVLESFRFVD